MRSFMVSTFFMSEFTDTDSKSVIYADNFLTICSKEILD